MTTSEWISLYRNILGKSSLLYLKGNEMLRTLKIEFGIPSLGIVLLLFVIVMMQGCNLVYPNLI